jgi:hypothetical protein
VSAGLQSNEQRGLPRPLAGGGKGVDFGVVSAQFEVGALSDNAATSHDHGANEWIWTDFAAPSFGQAQGAAHECGVC